MRNRSRETVFRFKQFQVSNRLSAMKVGTDGVLLGAWAGMAPPGKVLDIGAGTGLVSLMLAQRFRNATVTAIEIDPVATQEAEYNFAQSPWQSRLNVECRDFREWQSVVDEEYDLIVSNPPFFSNGVRSGDSSRAGARHSDTLSAIDVVRLSPKLLSPNGRVALIVPFDMTDDLIFNSALAGLYPRRRCDVVPVEGKRPIRALWEFSTSDGALEHTSLTIRTTEGYTDDYRLLTKDFYL